jgi:hypothetical protein
MRELEIKIEELKTDMQDILIKVDKFTKHGREASESERFEQIELLEIWLQLRQQLKVCEELYKTININLT